MPQSFVITLVVIVLDDALVAYSSLVAYLTITMLNYIILMKLSPVLFTHSPLVRSLGRA